MNTAYSKLLNEVCVRLGFCGSVVDNQPLHVDYFIPKDGLVSADMFADALFRAENWNPEGLGAYEFRPAIRDAFERHMGSTEVDARLLK